MDQRKFMWIGCNNFHFCLMFRLKLARIWCEQCLDTFIYCQFANITLNLITFHRRQPFPFSIFFFSIIFSQALFQRFGKVFRCMGLAVRLWKGEWMGASTTMWKGRVFLFLQLHIDELVKFEAVFCFFTSLQRNSGFWLHRANVISSIQCMFNASARANHSFRFFVIHLSLFFIAVAGRLLKASFWYFCHCICFHWSRIFKHVLTALTFSFFFQYVSVCPMYALHVSVYMLFFFFVHFLICYFVFLQISRSKWKFFLN